MVEASYLDGILGEESLHLYVKVFLVFLLLAFFFERLLPRFFRSPLLMLGVVAINFGVLMEFLLLISLAYVFRRRRKSQFSKVVSSVTILVVVLALFLYYLAFSGSRSAPVVSILFEGVSWFLICLTILRRMLMERSKGSLQRFSLLAFLTALLFAFSFFYYYEVSELFFSHYLIELPLYFTLLDVGEFLVLVGSVLFFIYSQSIPCRNFRFDLRTLLKIFTVPTIVFVPFVVMMVAKPEITKYISWLLVEILGFTLPGSLIIAYMASLWFYFAGIFALWEKGNVLGEHFHKQEAMALLIVFPAGFLSGFVYYYLMGLIGVLLLTSRLGST